MSQQFQRVAKPTGANADAQQAYAEALHQLQCFIGDPVASVDRALAAAPGMVLAHLLKAYLHLLGTEPNALPVARDCLAAARPLPMNDGERGHMTAIAHLLDGRWHDAGRVLEDVAIAEPRDILALQAGHQIDFFTGASRMLRDRIARALPAWHMGMTGYHAVLGMHAFGLEETGDYADAEAQGRRGVELEPRDGWAQHAVAHVLEMQGRASDGIAWMRTNEPGWSRDSFFAVHNWWHLALYHLELGEIDAVLALFDGPIHGTRSTVVLDMVDAAALLWRLQLRGIDVGARWAAVAEGWAPIATAGTYAFNDLHATMALTGAGRMAEARAILARQREVMAGADDNAWFTRDVGHPACQALVAFAEGDYATAVRLLRPIRAIAHRFGGSHAQRDVLDLTLIEAALRAGEQPLAAALAAERAALKPHSPLARLFVARAGAPAQAAQ